MSKQQNKELLGFIRRLTTAASTAGLYRLDHSQVTHLNQQALEHLKKLLADQDEFILMLIDGKLIHADKPVEYDFSVGRLSKFFELRRIAHLTIRQGVDESELLHLVDLISQKNFTPGKLEASTHITFGQVEAADQNEQWDETFYENAPKLEDIETEEIDRFNEIYEAVHKGKPLHVRGLQEIVGSFVKAFSEQGDSFLALAPLRNLDEYTYTHSTNVCILNIAQAKMLGIEEQMLYEIGIAAMLHDIGKLFVPAEILRKEGSLTDEEWIMIQQHPENGAEYLANTPGIPRLAVVTAYEHHMRYNCSGYPKVGSNWPQHICSQMTTISDFFDALRTHRSYRAGMDFDKISRIMMEESGTALHPQLTRNFLTCIQQIDESQLS
ncbi:HD-GYP domain, c-di-GMP phosphodiesterase class II (or its inactivated variant) [Malonomonas rubra DSM 5091]|uniref:HD-GYP domain, c-di-GMP phosphodiesterase class II (Or its inactivated variant) n=1 Tax=Malonomonas rubra DSM 5091 TaxID=1122189 RepID=A0A1M6DZI6_MALRU|nr:HD domain-containing phosphohydrolase [Malonomonas rubra]SHI78555.1 HD-GYP domain, c-di-GMP phosphodiesterase class II (or its inactivated variant) [Malonomonas rubra DSM 5091]